MHVGAESDESLMGICVDQRFIGHACRDVDTEEGGCVVHVCLYSCTKYEKLSVKPFLFSKRLV